MPKRLLITIKYMKITVKTIVSAVFAMTLFSCSSADKVPAIDLANLDTTVSPGEDFYRYSTGGWQDANPLTPEYARYGSFDALRENNVKRLNDLFASMSEMNPEKGSVDQKIVDLYKLGLDSARLNSEGVAPVKKYLEEIMAVPDKKALMAKVAELHAAAESPFFGAYVEADLRDSDSQVLYFSQGGLGLDERDYYLKEENAEKKAGYLAFLTKIFQLSDITSAPEEAAAAVLKVEDALAEGSWTSVETRDYLRQYNVFSSDKLEKTWPSLEFALMFSKLGIPAQDKVIVCQPSFFDALEKVVRNTPLESLKLYLAAQTLSGACNFLSDDFIQAHFDFFSRQLSGTTQMRPRWKRAMAIPNGLLGEAVGQMYVERYFPESSKKMMLELVENLRAALGQHIDSLEWMGPETKVRAREKLAAFTVKIGYPDKWKDYSTLTVDPSLSYYENVRHAGAWYVADNLSKLGKPTDKTEWGMTPQTVNAYYNPTTNEICFPAAILQPPFFNPDADAPVNYGGIGVVIGHEMSHGFDDQGRLFDAKGNMENWWTEEDNEKFKAKAQILVKQFDEVEVLPGVHANGAYTLGENIGDHGGLSIAFTAMQNAIEGTNPGLIDGFTPEQRFYLSYGAIWAQNITDEEKDRLTKLDVHSLAENRVNVSLRNFQSFFDAFGIKEGDKMYRPESERVVIW